MNQTRSVEITNEVKVGPKEKLLIIAGPCQIESSDHCLSIADKLNQISKQYPVNFVFKSSFDKANRTSVSSQRGIGLEKGLRILQNIRRETGLPVITDIHSPEQAEPVSEVVDILQTPAFLCRQTDLLVAAGKTNKPVNIKRGQFLYPQDMKFVAEKVSSQDNQKILLCERGSCFGYRDLVVDPRSLVMLSEIGYPVIFDATHSVQSMGGEKGSSGGSRQYILPLVKAAIAVGADGLFIECHDNPDNAPSDGASMLELEQLEEVVDFACRYREVEQAS